MFQGWRSWFRRCRLPCAAPERCHPAPPALLLISRCPHATRCHCPDEPDPKARKLHGVHDVNQLLPLVVARNYLEQKAAFVEWVAQVATRRDLHTALGFGKHSEEKIVQLINDARALLWCTCSSSTGSTFCLPRIIRPSPTTAGAAQLPRVRCGKKHSDIAALVPVISLLLSF